MDDRKSSGEPGTNRLGPDETEDVNPVGDEVASPGGGEPAQESSGTKAPGGEMYPGHIGRYRVDGRLAKGGFGQVFAGWDEQLGRRVAIKVPFRFAQLGRQLTDSVLAEARAMAKLDHPHIVPIHDVGSTEAFPCYIVSKFVDGESLQARLHRERLHYREAAAITATIAQALHYAHQRDLIHRDVKPSNILLDASGQPHLVDFGLALSLDGVQGNLTFLGTPSFASPEQARAEEHRIDGRSDVFSLGAVLYTLLANRRPFTGRSQSEILDKVIRFDPQPPRQRIDSIPRELERICLKALAKRAADRYATANDFADDLLAFLATERDTGVVKPLHSESQGNLGESSAQDSNSSCSERLSGVTPKGLRSFEAMDADFFLELVPGPKNRDGLPESIAFWKQRIESQDSTASFPVGILYGPSGCGKTSFVRAGLLPQLNPHVCGIWVEASPDDTEKRVLERLHHYFPELPLSDDLVSAIAYLRLHGPPHDSHSRWEGSPPQGGKVCIVIDQFEQWLERGLTRSSDELINAIRQCNGGRVQCLLLVRDDFWMAATRFMRAVEVPLVEGQNCAAVDLFSIRHACKVLTAFGQAYGNLPARGRIERSQQRFIEEAVRGLAQDDKVICVRLAIFAEMFKDKPWSVAALKEVGGTEGVGLAFLRAAFHPTTAPPERRLHHRAARATLAAMLPEPGSDIRGRMCPCDELLQASGYMHELQDFDELVQILDRVLRLITPVDTSQLQGAAHRVEPSQATVANSLLSPAPRDTASSAERSLDETTQLDPQRRERTVALSSHYQLTHDFMIGPLRQWLSEEQRRTRAGRAKLLLEELASETEKRGRGPRVPALLDYLFIALYGPRQPSTPSESRFLRVAHRFYRSLGLVLLCLAALVAFGWTQVRRRAELEELVVALRVADLGSLPAVITRVRERKSALEARLLALARETSLPAEDRVRATLAGWRDDAEQVEFLHDILTYRPAADIVSLCTALPGPSMNLRQRLLADFRDAARSHDFRLRAAAALAQLEEPPAASPVDWKGAAEWIVDSLILEDPRSVPDWAAAFRPLRATLRPDLRSRFADPGLSDAQRVTVAIILVEYAGEDAPLMAELALEATPSQFATLLPLLRAQRDEVAQRLEHALQGGPTAHAPPAPPDDQPLPATIAKALAAGAGVRGPGFVIAPTLPWEQFEVLDRELAASGWRLEIFRPSWDEKAVRVSALWKPSTGTSHYLLGRAEEIRAWQAAQQAEGWMPVDVGYLADSQEPKYAALWWRGDPTFGIVRSALYVDVPPAEHAAQWGPLNAAGYVPRTNLMVQLSDGEPRFSSVRWKISKSIAYKDAWNEDWTVYASEQQASWCQVDARITDARSGAGVWWTGLGIESRELIVQDLQQFGSQASELARERFHPVSISVGAGEPPLSVQCRSVWHRPITSDATLDAAAERDVKRAITLAQLGRGHWLRRMLRRTSDPRRQSYAIRDAHAYGLPAAELASWLREETDEEVRRSLILMLARYSEKSISDAIVDQVLLAGRDAQDPGVRSAAIYCLSGWRRDPSDLLQSPVAREIQTKHGHRLVVIPGPVEFQQGSLGGEVGRDQYREWQHPRRIPRSFALATTETTVAQFLKYDPQFNYIIDYSPALDCPINAVDWFDAMRYCRWLSEREGVVEAQMCYPQVSEIGPEMVLPADFLDRTGFRLPTEAEWEYAARAGAMTSHDYGNADALLDDYAWTARNSGYRAAPVGRLIPNRFGLFDMLGNVMEWCHDGYQTYPLRAAQPWPDSPDLMIAGQDRITRGAAFLYQPLSARCAQRDSHAPDRRRPYLGFRIARTVRP
jgi:hypothetical protein